MGAHHQKTATLRAVLACVGFALFSPCYSASSLHNYEGLSPSLATLSSSIVMLAEFVTLVAVACLSTRISALRTRATVLYGTAGLLALSILAPLPPAGTAQGAVACTLAAAGGCAKGIGALAWLEVFCTFEMRTVCLAFPAGMIGGAVVTSVLDLLPQPLATLLGTLGCVASLALLARMSNRDTERPLVGPETLSRDAWTFPWRPTVLMGIYSLASLCISIAGPAPSAYGPIRVIAVQAVYLMLILATLAGYMRLDIKVFQQMAAPLVIGGAVITLPALTGAFSPSLPLARMGFIAFSLYTYITFFNMAYRFGVNPLWLFGFSRAVRVVPSLVMSFVSPEVILAHEYAVLGAVIVLVSLGSSLFIAEETFDFTWGIHQVKDHAVKEAAPTLEEQCHQAAYLYGLTKREEEVLALLAQDRSTPEIEVALCISNGTARNHIQHVYKKLDVHSRPEVAEFLAREREKP